MKYAVDLFRPRDLSPMRSMTSLQREMNRLFGDFFDGFESWEAPAFEFNPSCDMEETDDQFLVTVDLPGVKKDDVKVELRNNVLSISGERKEEREEKTANRYMSERSQGSFFRSFTLPSEVDADRVEAAFENGELKVRIAKTASAKAHTVKIGTTLKSLLPHKEHKEKDSQQRKAG